MIVIVEGPDGSGKSTAAENLEGFETVHFGPVDDPFREYMDALKAARGRDVVFDRIWPSEVVYGDVLRDGSRLDEGHLRILRREALSQGVVMVKCLPPEGAVIQNVEGSEQMDGVDWNVSDIYDAYVEYQTPFPTITYDYTSRVSPDEAEVRSFATETTDLPGRGCARPDNVLFVHENMILYKSLWFAREMADTQYSERDLYWVHIDKFTDEHLEQLDPRAVKAIEQKPLKFFMGPDNDYWFQGFPAPFEQSYPDEKPQIVKHCTIT